MINKINHRLLYTMYGDDELSVDVFMLELLLFVKMTSVDEVMGVAIFFIT